MFSNLLLPSQSSYTSDPQSVDIKQDIKWDIKTLPGKQVTVYISNDKIQAFK